PRANRRSNLRDQIWKRGEIRDCRRAKCSDLGETFIDRGEIIFWRELCFLRVDRANPICKRFLRWDFAAQTGVIEVAMRIDQSGQERLLAKINDFTGVARFDFVKFSN